MTYSIKNFSQTTTYSVNDATANTNAISLTLLGRSLPNYGTYLNQNFVWLLENFSSDATSPPSYAIQGQLWWDRTHKFLNVYDGSKWNAVYGNLSSQVVNTSISSSTINAGTFGNSGATFTGATLTLTGNASVNALSAGQIGNTTSIIEGVIGSASASQGNITSLGTLGSLTVSGLTSTGNLTTSSGIYWSNGVAFVSSLYSNANVASYMPTYGGNISGTITTALQPYITSVGNLSSLSVSGQLIPSANTSYTLGNSTSYWSTIYGVSFVGTSTTAKYADLAEKYLPDADYEIGTVMMVGGTAEITQHDGSKNRAIGVISQYPAYKMNADQEGGVYVALKGRVPVKVIGPVEKGQALVGSVNGLATAQGDSAQALFAISLENHTENTIKLVESVIL